jgi:hypothetical protein
MEEKPDFERDLASIRNIMEQSVKFISLSGMAGVMAGIYALIASAYAYLYLFSHQFADYLDGYASESYQLLVVAGITLFASIGTGFYLSNRKAKRLGQSIWNATGKRMLLNLAVPLATGGAFALILLWHGYIGLLAPVCLLFYGLALVNASQNLFTEVRYLGYSELVLGVLSTIFIGYGLLFWAIGFGVLHIVYGVLMYRKYDA